VQVRHQGLEASFFEKISEIAQRGRHDKEKQGAYGDDKDLDPFGAGQEGDGQKKYIPREGDEGDDKQDVGQIERVVRHIEQDGKQHYGCDRQGQQPP